MHLQHPQKVYNFPELAIDDTNEFAKGQGYTVTKLQSKTNKQTLPTVRKIWLRCILTPPKHALQVPTWQSVLLIGL